MQILQNYVWVYILHYLYKTAQSWNVAFAVAYGLGEWNYAVTCHVKSLSSGNKLILSTGRINLRHRSLKFYIGPELWNLNLKLNGSIECCNL